MIAPIDVPMRLHAAKLMDDWLHRCITNYELEDRWPESDDPVIEAIAEQLWILYDDLRSMKADLGAFSWLVRRMLVCIRRFLHSATPYQWPRFCFQTGEVPFWLSFFQELAPKRYRAVFEKNVEQFKQFADSRYWPFLSRAEFKAAKRS